MQRWEAQVTRLQIQNAKQQQDIFRADKESEELKRKIKNLKASLDESTNEKDFYHKMALESKRKYKLCKLALNRLS